MLVLYIALAGLGIWLVAKEMGYERGWDDAVEEVEALLAARERSVVAREARKRCEVSRNARVR